VFGLRERRRAEHGLHLTQAERAEFEASIGT
jgi:hypothetical protein